MIPIFPEGPNGEPKNLLCAQEDTSPNTSIGIDMELTNDQLIRYNAIMQSLDDVECTFLHCLTISDIKRNYLRITREISETLELAQSGVAHLSANGGIAWQAEYAQCADGRTQFISGWKKCAASNGLNAGMLVLMVFKINAARVLIIAFNVI